MTLQRYLGQFVLPATAVDFTVDANPVALTSGTTYFMSGYSGESTAQLAEHVQAQIRALGAPYGSTNVVQSATTGAITISDLGGSTAIVWTDTDLRDLLGFTGNLSGASAYTGTNQARYCWFPTIGLSEYPGDLTQWFAPRSTSIPYRSPGGVTGGVEGNELEDGRFAYSLLPKADVITTPTTVFESLQKFWSDVIHRTLPFRAFPDRTLNASTSYKTCVWGVTDDEALGSFADYRERHIRAFNGLWDVEFILWKHVAAT
tara:strand:+ start:1605 stop:2384 length:780 start_codon:yes stop_codon:yes gene_type:complete